MAVIQRSRPRGISGKGSPHNLGQPELPKRYTVGLDLYRRPVPRTLGRPREPNTPRAQ
jgi:hypothetical protein